MKNGDVMGGGYEFSEGKRLNFTRLNRHLYISFECSRRGGTGLLAGGLGLISPLCPLKIYIFGNGYAFYDTQ